MTYFIVIESGDEFGVEGNGGGPTPVQKWWLSSSRITTGDRPMGSVAKIGKEKTGAGIVGKALEGLLKFIDDHRSGAGSHEEGFEGFEREVRKRFSEAEREFIGKELARQDVSLPGRSARCNALAGSRAWHSMSAWHR